MREIAIVDSILDRTRILITLYSEGKYLVLDLNFLFRLSKNSLHVAKPGLHSKPKPNP